MSLLCEKAKNLTLTSRCMYCGSSSYGKGCRFGPKGTHFHADDTTKCSYCSSRDFGKGCRMNPFSDLHLHGIPYNSMISEKLKNMLRNHTLLHELLKPLHEYNAYTLGIIDSVGRKIKEPINEVERASYSPLTRTLIRVKRYLGSKLDLLTHTSLLEGSSSSTYNQVNHKQVLCVESNIRNKINEIYEIIESALKDGITMEQIDDILQK